MIEATKPSVQIIHGDCREILPSIAENSVDTIITDPPYHLTQASRGGSVRKPGTGPFSRIHLGEKGFMGKTWDGGDIAFDPEIWSACLRIAKPGAYCLAFGGTRTWHRLACAIEDAGWKIVDSLCWLYGSGFPKSLNISGKMNDDIASQWGGWGTALKPAFEPIIVAMKPCDGTYADNATKHGVAGFNIDSSRIAIDPEVDASQLRSLNRNPRTNANQQYGLDGAASVGTVLRPEGRWPANVILDEEVARLLDSKTGILTSGKHSGASRFFYCAKSSPSERGEFNTHGTVKPLSLMRYLCRLTKTPTGGVVCDPFSGSGTTGLAAQMEGRQSILIEREAEYVKIIRKRLGIEAEPEFIEVEM